MLLWIKCKKKKNDVSRCQSVVQKPSLNSKQCRCRSTMARKNSLERQEPRKKPKEEPGYEGWPILFWLCWVEIIRVHGQDVQTFIDDQQGQIINGCRAVVLNLGSIEPQGFGESVSGVRRRSRHTSDSYDSWWHAPLGHHWNAWTMCELVLWGTTSSVSCVKKWALNSRYFCTILTFGS